MGMADITRAQETRRVRQIMQERVRYERQWMPRIEEAVRKQIAPFIRAVRSRGPEYALANINTLVDSAPMEAVLSQLWRQVGVSAGNSEYGFLDSIYGKEIRAQKAFGFNRLWADAMQFLFRIFGAERVVSITETERNRLRRELIQAQEENLDNYNLAERLEGALIPRRRSKVIARTETGTAQAAGRDAAARSIGLIMQKIWRSIQDKRTRVLPADSADHLHMNDVSVGMDEKFIVPGTPAPVLMDRPHDPSAPAKQTIQCRCVCIYKAVRDRAGRLIPQRLRLTSAQLQMP